MQRVVILGRGASGKSTLARRLGGITGLPVIEKLAAEDGWIMDGDLGPYDVVEVRLCRADTVIFLDFSLSRCAWRAIRRSRERADFWRWLLAYRCQSRPLLMQAIANQAASAALHVFRNPRALRRFVTDLAHNPQS